MARQKNLTASAAPVGIPNTKRARAVIEREEALNEPVAQVAPVALANEPEWKSLMDAAAQSPTYYKNHYIPALRDAFPTDARMWHVDRYYPFAAIGKLMIDLPQTREEEAVCKAKAQVILQLGYKYLLILPKDDLDTVVARLRDDGVDDGSH